MDFVSYLPELFKGLLGNVLITALSALLPLVVGIIFTVLAKQNVFLKRGVKAVSYIFECVVPVITILFLFYTFAPLMDETPRMLFCIVGFSISFLGYMASRYREDWSVFKNIVVNSLNTILAIFKWSFVASYIMVPEMLRSLMMFVSRSYDPSIYWLGLLLPLIVLIPLYLIKYALEEWMK